MFHESLYKRYQPSFDPPFSSPPRSYWLVVSSSRLLMDISEAIIGFPSLKDPAGMGLPFLRTQYLGTLNNLPCFSAETIPNASPPPGTAFYELRNLWGSVDEDLYLLAGRALQIVTWDRINQFCGACSHPTLPVPGERAKSCPRCNLLFYPRLSPAVITAVTYGNKILLGRRGGLRNMYTVFAGFVEPGETLEECLRREVYEEVGVSVKNINYYGSQPWPYPNSLMIGFTAEYASGNIQIDGKEVTDAGWYDASNMPEIPPKLSIAREIIDWFISHHPV